MLAYKLFVNERPRFEGPEKTFKVMRATVAGALLISCCQVEGLLEAQAYRFRVQVAAAAAAAVLAERV